MKSPDERVVSLLQEARRQLELERNRRTEPIAIVGIGCRFPGGVESASDFWRMLRAGVSATREVPTDRWDVDAFYDPDPDVPGKAYTKRGSFLSRVDAFDAAFFGISPREAEAMDPQQRLLLEVAWEALEDAGIIPDHLRKSSTGVWVGLCTDDYAHRSISSGNPATIDAYNTLGNTRSVAAGRLSYLLDLQGPAVQLDTACSSSLVAVHLACQSLRLRECNLALVGGVNLMLAPESTIALCKLRALSPDGTCKTFDAAADGYGRGEGCGIVVLKRLSDAELAGNHIYASIRGSASNHDGHSNGLTAPSGTAQEAVIRAALANASIDGSRVGYVEAHGTGTLLGDPIELLALSRVYAQNRSASAPLHVGAVKTNFGHLEGAAGVAGLIKAALCVRHGEIPPHLNFEHPNPKISWANLCLRVATRALDWPRTGKARIAGVSSFGISGTNAHVVLEEAPEQQEAAAAPVRSAELIVLSAKTAESLSVAAGRLKEHLEQHAEQTLGDVAYSLVTTRALHEQRLCVSAASRPALLEELEKASGGETPAGAWRGALSPSRGKLAWLFTGQGAQQIGMGKGLYGEWPVFRQALEEVCERFDRELEVPLREVMWAEAGTERAALLDETGYTQPALFALEWALAALWRSWGVEPGLVLGHSIGGLTAAAVAGVFSLEDAVKLVAARARLMQALPPGGAMLSLTASEAEVREAVAPLSATVSLAAINGPASVVVAGDEAEVTAIAERFGSRGVKVKRLVVSHAFHSPRMEPMLQAFWQVAESIHYQLPRIALVSDTTGKLAGAEVTTPDYWVRHVRETVRFAPAVQALAEAGADTFLELGPRPTLLGLVPACLPEREPRLLVSLRSSQPEPEALLEALGGWIAHGGTVDWQGVFPTGGRRVQLPTYPWQRERFWIETQQKAANGSDPEQKFDVVLNRLLSRGLLPRAARDALPDILSAWSKALETFHFDRVIAGWAYSLDWRAITLPVVLRPADGTWAVLGHGAESEALRAAFGRAGVVVHIARDIEELRVLVTERSGMSGVVHWLATRVASEDDVLAMERLLASTDGCRARAWWITRGAVGTSPTDPPTDLDHSAVWGLGRTFALEHPRTWGGMLDVSTAEPSEKIMDRIVSLLLGPHGEDQLALRGERVFVPRIRHARLQDGSRHLSTQGTVMITGGLGALGLHVARWLARKGTRQLLLLSRQGSTAPGAQRVVEELAAMGTRAVIVAADVTDREAMSTALEQIPPDKPLTAVFHAAGLSDKTSLDELTPERLREVLAPKRDGTRILAELTADLPIEAFVCFSSIAGVWGSGKQAAYAASNCFLDAWAQSARASGRPAFSISWGPWGEGGMADAESLAQLSRRGLVALDPQRALDAIDLVLASERTHTVIASVDWAKFRVGFEAWAPRKLLDDVEGFAHENTESEASSQPLIQTLLRSNRQERLAHLCTWLAEQCAAVLGYRDPSSISMTRGFFDIGLDSLMVVELRRKLERAVGRRMSAGLMFSHPNISSLAEYLANELVPVQEDPPSSNQVAAATATQEVDLESEDDVMSFINSRFEAEK